jgi:hypothetical protein
MQMTMRGVSVAMLAFSASIAFTSVARADAIDGDWCFGASSLFVKGPAVRTPGGNEIQAAYDRHGIRYVVPASEPGAGGEVVMRLLNEENAVLVRKAGTTESAPETWKRCKPVS